MKNKIVRIKDIAEKANVSAGTVDRVLHNRGRVAEDVKERILKIISEMNYEPNYEARALGSKKEYRIAAIIPDYHYDAYWFDPKKGIDKAARELAQYNVTVEYFYFALDSEASFIAAVDKANVAAPDGIILAPMFSRATKTAFSIWKKQKIPFVIFNTEIESNKPLCYIGQNYHQSGILAAKMIHIANPAPCHILIAHIDESLENSKHLISKEAGFMSYFEQPDIKDMYTIKRVELSRRDYLAFIKQLNKLIMDNPELQAIYVSNSRAYEIAAYLEQQRLNHIKIIGYDLVPKNISHIRNGMISFVINQHPRGQGYRGLLQLADYLVFKKTVIPRKILPLDLITRENLDYYLEDGFQK